MNTKDRLLGVLAIALFVALAFGFSHFAEKVSGDDDGLRVKAEKAIKNLKYKEAHGYLQELLKKGEAKLADKKNMLLCLEKLREWDQIQSQLDSFISTAKDDFEKGMLLGWKARELSRQNFWGYRDEVVKTYGTAHGLIGRVKLNTKQEEMYGDFLMEEIRHLTSYGNDVELEYFNEPLELLEKLNIDKNIKARGNFLIVDLLAKYNRGNKEYQAEVEARFKKIFENYNETPSAKKAHLSYGRYLANNGDFLKAIEHYSLIEKNWPGTKEAFEAVKSRVDITAPRLGLAVERVFASREKGKVKLTTRNQRDVELSVYKIELLGQVLEFKDLERVVFAFKPGDQQAAASIKHKFEGEEDHTWQETYVEIPLDSSGAYIVVAKGGKVANRTLLLISDLASVIKTVDNQVFVYAANSISGEPAAEAEVLQAYAKNDKPEGRFDTFNQGKTDSTGRWLGKVESVERYTPLLIITKAGDNYALAGKGSYYRHLRNNTKQPFFYSYTDRAVYRPGQQVNFKSILRNKDVSGYTLPTKAKVTAILNEPSRTEKKRIELEINEYGTVSGSFALEEECPLGGWNIRLESPDGWQSYIAFKVEEYKKPEYEVIVDIAKSQYRIGEKISATVAAKYFYGEPVKEAEVTYQVYRTFRYWHFRSPDSWDWFYGDSGRSRYYDYNRELVHEGDGKLDQDGHLLLEIPTEMKEGDSRDQFAYDYRIMATVRDASRRNIDGSGQTVVSSHEFNSNIRSDKYIYAKDDLARVSISTRKYDGNVIASKGALVLYQADWNETKSDYDLKKISSTAASTDSSGEGKVSLKLPAAGRMFLQYETADAWDNVINSRCSVYVSNKDFRGKLEGTSGLEILADKDVYFSGDTAKIMVSSSLSKTWAWVTVEAEVILESRVVPLETGMNIIDLKINSSFQPNAYVKVLAFSDNQVFRKEIEIKVPPVEKFADITLTANKSEYQPGEKGTYTVEVKDNEGKPLQGEFSIGVMDASLDYFGSDQTPDIRKHFYAQNRGDVIRISGSWEFRAFSREQYSDNIPKELFATGRNSESMVALSPGVESEEAFDDESGIRMKKEKAVGGNVAAQLRTEFKDSALWLAHVTTDATGKGTARITWPDNLTRWRAVARVVTKDTIVGAASVNVVTKKNLLVRLQTPRFLVQGDKATISLNIHNYLKTAKTATVDFKTEGLRLMNAESRKVEIPSGGEARVDVEVMALVSGEAKITGTALTNEESDAMQLTLPVLVHGIEKFEGGAGSINEDKTVTLTLPEEIREGSASLRISVNPTVARTMLESLPYLVEYPYGCVEQTMSRFLPAAVVAKALQDMGYDQPELHEKLPDVLKKGLNRLYDFQHSDGGWGWWKHDSSSPYMTAYVVYGLTLADSIGVAVRQDVLQRGRQFLTSQLENLADQVETLNFAIFALSGGGKIEEKFFNRIEDLLPKMKEYETALFAVSLANQKQTERFERVITSLEKMAKRNEKYGTASWGEEGGYYWYQDNVESTSLSLMALMRKDPHSDLTKEAVRWLMSTRKGGKWKSTRDTAFAVLALSEYMKTTEELNPDNNVEVFLNGKSVRKIHFTKDNILSDAGEILLEAKDLKAGKQDIRIVSSGKGNVYYDVFLKYFSLEEPITAASTTIAVERKYYRIREEADSENKVRIHRQEVKDGEVLTSGETIEVELTLKSDNIYEYLVYEDFKPAGCEPVDRTSGRRWDGLISNMELRDEKVAFFIGHLPVGESKVSYRLRVEIPGKFHTLPVNGYAMYSPDIRAISDEFIMEIKDK